MIVVWAKIVFFRAAPKIINYILLLYRSKHHQIMVEMEKTNDYIYKKILPAGVLVAAIGAACYDAYELITGSCIERSILKAKCRDYKANKLHIERKELNEYIEQCLHKQENLEYALWTMVIYGPIGCGKSVAVREALKHHVPTGSCRRYSHWNYSMKDDFVTQVLQEVLPLLLAGNTYTSMRKVSSTVCCFSLIFLKADVNTHSLLSNDSLCGPCQPDDLYDLMHLLKYMVHRECLAQAFVILSPWSNMRKTMISYICLRAFNSKQEKVAVVSPQPVNILFICYHLLYKIGPTVHRYGNCYHKSTEVPNARLCSVPQKEHTFPSTVELKLYWILFVQLKLSQAVSETLHS